MKGQELKSRIAGVEETVKITKAMQMIASSKLLKTQQRFASSKVYFHKAQNMVRLFMAPGTDKTQFFGPNAGDRCVYIIISGDKGFCGDYNQLVLSAAFNDLQHRNVIDIFVVGKVAIEYFKKREIEVDRSYVHLLQNPMPYDAKIIATDLIDKFIKKKIDQVYLVFTKIHGLSMQKVVVNQILPIKFIPQKQEPTILNADKSIETMITQYLAAEIYYALTSATLAINYKTMVAMQQATSNGEEMSEQLTMEYNRKRQDNITNELADVSTSLQGRRL